MVTTTTSGAVRSSEIRQGVAVQLAGGADDSVRLPSYRRPDHAGPDHGGTEPWWRVGCRDVVNRERFLTVLIDRDRVVLVGPPGETAVLSPIQVGQLSEALRLAADQAEG